MTNTWGTGGLPIKERLRSLGCPGAKNKTSRHGEICRQPKSTLNTEAIISGSMSQIHKVNSFFKIKFK